MLESSISIIIPAHNRPRYLSRLLSYYSTTKFAVCVVDSAPEYYPGSIPDNTCYYHMPNVTLPTKITFAIKELVKTPYVLMCADDDFIISGSILKCADFLDNNSDYSVALAPSICYYKDQAAKGKMLYAVWDGQESIESDDPIERMQTFFKSYYLVLYGVFRTEVFKATFENAETVISNLFLKEYMSGIYPLAIGKIKIMPALLYAINEAPTASSATRTTVGLVKFMSMTENKPEYENYISYLARSLAPIVHKDYEDCKKILNDIFGNLVELVRQRDVITFEKKVAKLISYIPFGSSAIILAYRKFKATLKIKKIFNLTQEEQEEVNKIENIILSYAS